MYLLAKIVGAMLAMFETLPKIIFLLENENLKPQMPNEKAGHGSGSQTNRSKWMELDLNLSILLMIHLGVTLQDLPENFILVNAEEIPRNIKARGAVRKRLTILIHYQDTIKKYA